MSTWKQLNPVEQGLLIEDRIRRYLAFASDLATKEGNVCRTSDQFLMESMKAFLTVEQLHITEIYSPPPVRQGVSYAEALEKIQSSPKFSMYRPKMLEDLVWSHELQIPVFRDGNLLFLSSEDREACDWQIAVQTD